MPVKQLILWPSWLYYHNTKLDSNTLGKSIIFSFIFQQVATIINHTALPLNPSSHQYCFLIALLGFSFGHLWRNRSPCHEYPKCGRAHIIGALLMVTLPPDETVQSFTLFQVYAITGPGSIICQHFSRPDIIGITGEVWPPFQHLAMMLQLKVCCIVEVKPSPDHWSTLGACHLFISGTIGEV